MFERLPLLKEDERLGFNQFLNASSKKDTAQQKRNTP
jgi:hypothetical protein